jgi:Fic family protein
LTIHAYFQQQPISNTTSIRQKTELSQPTVIRSLTTLEKLGIVKEITGKERHKVFVYDKYLDILKTGTEPLRY